MNYIEELRAKNIKFIRINEVEAEKILKSEYSFFKIMEFSENFERYISTDKKGQFVNLDFSQLYYLTKIDERLCEIVMSLCLEIEQIIKTVFINDMISVCNPNEFISTYYQNDRDYLQNVYTTENFDIMQRKYSISNVTDLEFYQFIDLVQFGTLERMLHSFYKMYAIPIYNSEFAPFEKLITSVKRIRNRVAHNNSLLNQLKVENLYNNPEVSTFLGVGGIKSRTLKTNFSKAIVFDLVSCFYLYFKVVPNYKTECHIRDFRNFDMEYCQKYKQAWCENATLKSVYDFIKQCLQLFCKELNS